MSRPLEKSDGQDVRFRSKLVQSLHYGKRCSTVVPFFSYSVSTASFKCGAPSTGVSFFGYSLTADFFSNAVFQTAMCCSEAINHSFVNNGSAVVDRNRRTPWRAPVPESMSRHSAVRNRPEFPRETDDSAGTFGHEWE